MLMTRLFRNCTRAWISAAATFLFVTTVACAEDDSRGRAVFAEHCASCHGERGEGVIDVYSQPLTGDKSIKELSRYLHTSMPDGSPEDVEGEAAEAVAKYVYDAFYSPVAQVRIAPPKIRVSRLTDRQLQHSLSDSINFHRTPNRVEEKRGITGRYYNSKHSNNKKQIAERVDDTVDFTFAANAPDKSKFDEDDFSVQWFGGIIAPETGHYKFHVESTGAFVLAVNSDIDEPLIDQLVKSGDETEFEGTVFLAGGRTHNIEIKLSHARSDDAYLRLKWTRPHGVKEIVPARYFVPGWYENFPVITTSLPADDASTGYGRGTSVSQEWTSAAAQAAVEAATIVADNIDTYARINRKDSAEKRAENIRNFAFELARVAYRRPPTADELEEIRLIFEGQQVDAAMKMAALRIFASPKFLYREAGVGSFDSHAAASWISYAMWDSVPDRRLRDAANKGSLDREQRYRQRAEQAINDPRARAKLRDFFLKWLRTDQFHGLAKNSELYPGFDDYVVADLKTSLELFLDDVLWGDNPDFRRLLRSRELYLNKRLADLYAGGQFDGGEREFKKVSLDGEPRAGLVSHPYLMAGFSYDRTTSPIHRGVFLSRSILGRILKAPPEAVSPLAPDLAPELTTRERVHEQTRSTTCQSCHAMINPLGFALENFDAVGRFRTREQDKQIDASGVYVTSDGDDVKFQNVADLADWVAESDEARAAFVSHLFHYTIKQPILAFGGLEYRAELVDRFKKNNHDVRKLWVDIVATSAERMRQMSEARESVAKK